MHGPKLPVVFRAWAMFGTKDTPIPVPLSLFYFECHPFPPGFGLEAAAKMMSVCPELETVDVEERIRSLVVAGFTRDDIIGMATIFPQVLLIFPLIPSVQGRKSVSPLPMCSCMKRCSQPPC